MLCIVINWHIFCILAYILLYLEDFLVFNLWSNFYIAFLISLSISIMIWTRTYSKEITSYLDFFTRNDPENLASWVNKCLWFVFHKGNQHYQTSPHQNWKDNFHCVFVDIDSKLMHAVNGKSTIRINSNLSKNEHDHFSYFL